MSEKITEAVARHRAEVKASRERIAPIPADLKVNPQLLGNLTNEQFVKAFGQLQQFVIDYYKAIENDPVSWGYPEPYKQNSGNGGISVGPHEKRLTGFLYAMAKAGQLEPDNGELAVDYKEFNRIFRQWKHSKPEAMVKNLVRAMLENLVSKGLTIEGFSPKKEQFTVAFPANPDVLQVMQAYFSDRPCRRCYGTCGHMGRCYWLYYPVTPMIIFSYRFIEDPAEQGHPAEFLAVVSGMPEEMQEIQYYLYSEAMRYGYRFDPFKPVWAGGLLYEKGAKDWPRVGFIGDGWSGDDYRMFSFRAHVKFKNVFVTHPEKIMEFHKQRPDVLPDPGHMCNQHCGNTLERPCPAHRVTYEIDGVTYHNCGGIRVHNPTLEDVKKIVELYILEHNLE